jgi:hypothetical protein
MKSATRVVVSTLGALAGLMGIEHGIGETLQGNVAPDGTVISSWPGSAFFSTLGGEPAMTIIPNLLVTGILAILFSLVFLVWATLFVQRKHAGLALILLSIVMLLVGGGFGPPILGILVGATATRINAPFTWLHTHLPAGLGCSLGKLWPWSFSACIIAWLSLFPGLVLLDYYFGVDNPSLVYAFILGAFGFLGLTVFIGFAHDVPSEASKSILVPPISPISQNRITGDYFRRGR